MCGIVGTLGGNTELVESASAVIKHRGPDDSGVFVDKSLNIGLFHHKSVIYESNKGFMFIHKHPSPNI